jgi:hypothetical protein
VQSSRSEFKLLFTTRWLNKSEPLEKNISNSRYNPPYHHQLLLIRGLHYTLCDLASSPNRMYALQILIDFSLSFINLTYDIYFCISCVTQLHIQSDVTESAGVIRAFSISVVWLSLVTILLAATAASCNAASTQLTSRRRFSWRQSSIRIEWGRPKCFCSRWLNDLCTLQTDTSSLHWGQ